MYLKRLTLVLTVLAVSLGLQAQSEPAQASEKANSFMEHGEFKKALKTLDKAIEDNSQDVHLLTERADMLITMERYKEAKKDIAKAINIDDQHSKAMLVKAKMMYINDQRDSAIYFIDNGLSFNPTPSTTESLYSLKGNIFMALDRYEEAEEMLYRAAHSPEVSIETMKNLATVLVENDKLDEAVVVLKETLEIFGHHLESYINTGYVCNQIGMYDEAIYYLDEALSIER